MQTDPSRSSHDVRLREKGWQCIRPTPHVTPLWHPPFPHQRAYFAYEAEMVQAEYEAGARFGSMRCIHCLGEMEKVAKAKSAARREAFGRVFFVCVLVAASVAGAALAAVWIFGG